MQSALAETSLSIDHFGHHSEGENNLPKYLCLQRSLAKDPNAEPSPLDMQSLYAKFQAWQEQFADQLVDMGGKLGEGQVVRHERQLDGAFVEVNKLTGGYMIVSADSMESAVEVARACPGLVRPGSGVEVIEIGTP